MNSRPANSLRRRVAELLVVRASGLLSDQQRRYPQWELPNSELQRLLQEGVGGVILLGGSAVELQQRTQQLQGWSDQRLLFCADVEEGVGQRFVMQCDDRLAKRRRETRVESRVPLPVFIAELNHNNI